VHYLAVQRTVADPAARATAWARRWGLTPRQTEVLLLLLAGEGNKAIASRLGCAEKTVEIHVGRILALSGLPGRAAVIAHLLRATDGSASQATSSRS
jgi:DNA-binding CsgD family transcriptional regulator